VKADWDLWGVHGRTNADIYHSDYKAIQVQKLVTLTDANNKLHTNTINLNAASATIEGGELEATIPADGARASKYRRMASYIFPRNTAHIQSRSVPWGPRRRSSTFRNGRMGSPAPIICRWTSRWAMSSVSANLFPGMGHQYDSVSPGEIYLIEPSYELLDVRGPIGTMQWDNPVDLSFFMKNALDTTYGSGRGCRSTRSWASRRSAIKPATDVRLQCEVPVQC